MEKRISFVEFQSVKSVAKAIDPYLRLKSRLENQIAGIDDEFKAKAEEELIKLKARLKANMDAKKEKLETALKENDSQIAAIEAGIVSIIGFHVTDLVKKVREPNEKGDVETKYVPTEIVSYDNAAKEYVISTPDNSEEETQEEQPIVPPTTENGPGSDYDRDAESLETEEASEEEAPTEASDEQNNNLPWEQ